MRQLPARRRSWALVLTIAALSIMLVGPGGPLPQPPPHPSGQDGPPSAGRGTAPVEPHRSQARTAGSITERLGASRTGGAYVSSNGTVVVTTTTAGATATVRELRARARRVPFSMAQLRHAQATLNQFAREHGAGQVQNWYIDIRKNAVVVTVRADAHDRRTAAFIRKARSLGEMVVIRRRPGRSRSVATHLYDGHSITLSNGKACSSGFSAITASGDTILLTAGHCTKGWPTAWRNGHYIGPTRARSFPGNDYAAITIARPGYWDPVGAVAKSSGYARVVLGHRRPPVGARVCKSGPSSGWTCGRIQAYHQAVNYGNGNIVYGLVRFSACVEPGDSGSPTMWGNYAVGIVSGAQFYRSGGSLVCGQRVGRPNVSFYQPIGEVLDAFNATLITY